MINKQTTLDLNGPVLSFTQHPSSVTVSDQGSATFVGLATATFPSQDPANLPTNTGTISYRWYDQNGPLSDGPNITGSTTTTLSITNLRTPGDNNRRIYLKADYIPSAYGLSGVPVTVGSARSTGNASNDTLDSNIATITVFSNISITSQPSSSTVSQEVSTTFSVVASLSDGTQSGLSYKWMLNENDLVDSSTVSGSSTPNLTISSSVIGTYSVRVRITHPTAGNSPLYSQSVQFGVIPSPLTINTETVTNSSASASLSSHNLSINGDLYLPAANYTDSTTLISLYAPNRDIDVEMDIYGGKGIDFGSYSGGQGGYSRIAFTMKQNEEYVISGLNVVDNCPYIYRKGKLIASVGSGGDASSSGSGGAGGGVNLSGAAGGGVGAGVGGRKIRSGELTTTGVFGSSSSSTPISPDTKESGQNGGRTVSCSKGSYWTSRGFSSCEDIGNVKLYLGNGTEITNSAQIQRGYKAGYSIKQTAGAGAPSTTTTRLVSKTCTRTLPQTCYRSVAGPVTKSVIVTDTEGAIATSGDFFIISRYNNGATGTEGNLPGIIGYRIEVTPLGLSDFNYSVSVNLLDSTTRASGLIDPNSSIRVMPGYPYIEGDRRFFVVAFDMIASPAYSDRWSGRQATYARRWSITLNGTQTTQQPYDCSTTESYDCSYYETVPISGGGKGGNGVTGGTGGSISAGGGGGSGYTDGSVTVVSSTVGGSNSAGIYIRSNVSPVVPITFTSWVRYFNSSPSGVFGSAPYGEITLGTPIIVGDNISCSGYLAASVSAYYTFQSRFNDKGEILNTVWDTDYISISNSDVINSYGTSVSGSLIMSNGRLLHNRSSSTFDLSNVVSLSLPCNTSLISDISGNIYGSSYNSISSLTSSFSDRWNVLMTGGIITCMDILPNGNLVAGGYAQVSGSTYQAQFYILSSTNGSVVSAYKGQSGNSVFINDIATDSSGNIYTVGRSPVSLQGTMITKLNSFGTKIWEYDLQLFYGSGGTGIPVGMAISIAVDSTSNVFILTASGSLIKYDSSGNYQWGVGLYGVGSPSTISKCLRTNGSSLYVSIGRALVKLSTNTPPPEGKYGNLEIVNYPAGVYPTYPSTTWSSVSVSTSPVTNTITSKTRSFSIYSPVGTPSLDIIS